eukprot:CAMPEP_0172614878 /NCGR_PEP_ID=MMETSP1068-20121228/55684_1 /TAXON_ID=35684 /ORGANISM="Pseudopedinella elastica, Strain CCMP716" /LENGTH=46 /DNA_ID= /DNA_START= /DNA_END= /DNA_ORIENTATION=
MWSMPSCQLDEFTPHCHDEAFGERERLLSSPEKFRGMEEWYDGAGA